MNKVVFFWRVREIYELDEKVNYICGWNFKKYESWSKIKIGQNWLDRLKKSGANFVVLGVNPK